MRSSARATPQAEQALWSPRTALRACQAFAAPFAGVIAGGGPADVAALPRRVATCHVSGALTAIPMSFATVCAVQLAPTWSVI
jgi:hypothetical protein